MAAHLSSGRVNLTALREAGRRELREFLDKCAGSKVSGGGRGRSARPTDRPPGGAPGPDASSRPAGDRLGRVPDRALRADRAVLAAEGKRGGGGGAAAGVPQVPGLVTGAPCSWLRPLPPPRSMRWKRCSHSSRAACLRLTSRTSSSSSGPS